MNHNEKCLSSLLPVLTVFCLQLYERRETRPVQIINKQVKMTKFVLVNECGGICAIKVLAHCFSMENLAVSL